MEKTKKKRERERERERKKDLRNSNNLRSVSGISFLGGPFLQTVVYNVFSSFNFSLNILFCKLQNIYAHRWQIIINRLYGGERKTKIWCIVFVLGRLHYKLISGSWAAHTRTPRLYYVYYSLSLLLFFSSSSSNTNFHLFSLYMPVYRWRRIR